MKNKENTKRRLLDAVDYIIKHTGIDGLGVNKVAKIAGVSKILIYRYFGSFEQLIKTYIMEKDFWTNYQSGLSADKDLSMHENIGKLLTDQFNSFYNHCEMEAVLLNNISNYADVVNHLSNSSYSQNRQLFSAKEEHLANRTTYFDVISMLLLAGTNHLILNTRTGNHDKGEKEESAHKVELLHSIGQIVDWTFG